MLYGLTTSNPVNSTACAPFLRCIGDSIEHLGHIRMKPCCLSHCYRESFKLLGAASSLETLTLDSDSQSTGNFGKPSDVVTALLPMLQDIQSSRKTDNGRKAVVNIVRFNSGESPAEASWMGEGNATSAAYRSEVALLLKEALE